MTPRLTPPSFLPSFPSRTHLLQVWISYADRLEQPGDIFKVPICLPACLPTSLHMPHATRSQPRAHATPHHATPRIISHTFFPFYLSIPTPPKTPPRHDCSTCTSGASGRAWRCCGARGPSWRRRPATSPWPTASSPRAWRCRRRPWSCWRPGGSSSSAACRATGSACRRRRARPWEEEEEERPVSE